MAFIIFIFSVVCAIWGVNYCVNRQYRELRDLRKRCSNLQSQMDEIEQIARQHFTVYPELSTILLDEINVFHVRTNKIGRGES